MVLQMKKKLVHIWAFFWLGAYLGFRYKLRQIPFRSKFGCRDFWALDDIHSWEPKSSAVHPELGITVDPRLVSK